MVMTIQPDLLDLPVVWKTDPMKGFQTFVMSVEFVEMGKHGKARKAEGRPVYPINKKSAAVYTHMFANFLRWLESRRLKLDEVSEVEMREFLDARHAGKDTEGKKLNSLIRVRYLRLLERVYSHLGATNNRNPATKTAYGVHRTPATGRDKPKVFLTDKEQAAFLAALPDAEPFNPDQPDAPSWKKRRDRAMLAMMLGAGLKVSEVLALHVQHVGKKDSTGSIPVRVINPAIRSADNAHKTLLRSFAVPYVLPWLEERKHRRIPGQLLFPATLKEDKPLAQATVYRHVKGTLERAGLAVERMGGRTLRNSFAVTELRNNKPIDLVGAFLGHYERRSTEKYLIAEKQREISE
jgi:site-specific recombinase XerD